GQALQLVLSHALPHFPERLVAARVEHGPPAHATRGRPHVHEELRRLEARALEDELRAAVGMAASGGDRVRPRGVTQEIRVADGRADRVRVGVSMADDVDGHGTGRERELDRVVVVEAAWSFTGAENESAPGPREHYVRASARASAWTPAGATVEFARQVAQNESSNVPWNRLAFRGAF